MLIVEYAGQDIYRVEYEPYQHEPEDAAEATRAGALGVGDFGVGKPATYVITGALAGWNCNSHSAGGRIDDLLRVISTYHTVHGEKAAVTTNWPSGETAAANSMTFDCKAARPAATPAKMSSSCMTSPARIRAARV